MKTLSLLPLLALLLTLPSLLSAQEKLNVPPDGATALFNGENLEGWWGLGTKHYKNYADLSEEDFAKMREGTLADINKHWSVKDGILINDGKGLYLTTDKMYGDFELWVDYKTVPRADSGIYLRGIPQVQIWDSTEEKKFGIGADKGSGGLWNNPGGSPGKDPAVLADKPFGEWNSFHITMVGERVSVELNGKLVVDAARMANFFEKKTKAPIPKTGPIQLQTHGGEISWRNVFIREIDGDEANKWLRENVDGDYKSIFNGKDWTGWKGPTGNNEVKEGSILAKAGTIYTEEEYEDFTVRFDFKIPPGGNNGLAIRYPGKGDTAYLGMCELQVLDSAHKKYAGLHAAQHHASAYGMAAATRGFMRPANEWNHQTVRVVGSTIQVELNGVRILDTDLNKLDPEKLMYPIERFKGRTNTKGHFGFAGHGAAIHYRNVEVQRH